MESKMEQPDVDEMRKRFRESLGENAGFESINKKGTIENAVGRAYDDMCRTLHGASRYPDLKSNLVEDVSQVICKYFEGEYPADRESFNDSHTELCKECEESVSRTTNGGLTLERGQAQKVVNMTFKYLYCVEDLDDKEAYFKYCHIPLDSYTMRGLKRITDDRTDKEMFDGSWSRLDSDQYEKIRDFVAKKFEDNKKLSYNDYEFEIPLDAELCIWAMELAIESMKNLGDILGEEASLEKIKRLLDQLQKDSLGLSESEKKGRDRVRNYLASE